MKNKNGFTIIELLAVIAILAIISTIATFTIIKILNKNKDKALETKEAIILKQARQYGKDNEEELFYDIEYVYGEYTCNVITVNDLVEAGYLDADDKDTSTGEKDVINPKTGTSMKNRRIILYIKSKVDSGDPNYTTVGIFNGSVISLFDNHLCAVPGTFAMAASQLYYNNSNTHVNCATVQCMLDHISGMLD